MLKYSLVLLSVLVRTALTAEYVWGRCPTPTAMEDFDMAKFIGRWYVIEAFDKGEKCMTWTVSQKDSPDSWQIVEEKENGIFSAVGLAHATFNTGTLTQPDKKNPANLRSFWPMSGIAGDGSFTVHTTDYDNYAGIFECQNVGLFRRQNGLVLSRTPVLRIDLKQMARILAPGIEVTSYSKVLQGNCKYRKNLERTDNIIVLKPGVAGHGH
ncbi:apolipoprotein D-like [Macrobrachium rosenbergii]|uniref:apolipoprotein D-like n=1 Tax=Macrobrachium rosenbergii TaxID=79674 RepID=UPI0034D77300